LVFSFPIFKHPITLQHVIKTQGNDDVGNDAAYYIVDVYKGGDTIGACDFQYNAACDNQKKTPQLLRK
jgi:hypothetical protein